MPYLPDQHTYLHNSSLLIQAYPTTRITTKYSLPRRPNTHTKRTTPSKRSLKATATATTTTTEPADATTQQNAQGPQREKKEPSAILTLKTFHPESGICLKYRTEKAQEVGRLMAGLGRLARGEIIEMPETAEGKVGGGDAMEVDSGAAGTVKTEDKIAVAPSVGQGTQGGQSQQQQGGGGGGGGGKKKKKGKK